LERRKGVPEFPTATMPKDLSQVLQHGSILCPATYVWCICNKTLASQSDAGDYEKISAVL
jgi:hypothetical protein